jgi:Spy/CpxP family protein refolding chaperone
MMEGYGGYGMGPGMMGPGMMEGYGGYGMGPGMMGPGMMGGYGGYGMGSGMMANASLYALDLSDDQRAKIIGIRRDLRNRMLDLGVKMTERSAKLIQFYGDETPDRKAIVSNYKALQDLQNEGLEARLDASEKVEAVLTKVQREQLRASGAGWMRP